MSRDRTHSIRFADQELFSEKEDEELVDDDNLSHLLAPSSRFGSATSVRPKSFLEHRNGNDDDDAMLGFGQSISILTRITLPDTSDPIERKPLCLQQVVESNSQIFIEDCTSFVPNEDPGIDAYMELKETDEFKGWERYVRECHKYSMPKLSPVKDIFDNKTYIFDLRVK